VRAWFDNLEQRERLVLSIGAILASLIILWALVWTPLRGGAAELEGAVAEKQQLLAQLQRAQGLSGSAAPGPAGAPLQTLVVLVDQTHRAHGLAGTLQRNQPDGTDGIRVTFQAAGFDSLMEWLVALQRSYGIAVESADFDGTRQVGVVSATLVLRRS